MSILQNPYPADGPWLRGNLHTHTTESDGERPPANVVADYSTRGYDFLALSDHDTFTDPASVAGSSALELIPAVEISSDGPHLLHIGATHPVEPDPDRQAVVDAIRGDEGIAIPAHPKWKAAFEHWSHEQLSALVGITALEIYNGLVEGHPGGAIATDRWDRLLSAGHRVWGIASDDAHRGWEVERGWTVVRTADRSPAGILSAIAAGACYASTGVTVRDVTVKDGVVAVETTDADRIRLISDHGVVQQTTAGPTAQFRVPEQLVHRSEHTYVRVACEGAGGARAWLQPMFLTAADEQAG